MSRTLVGMLPAAEAPSYQDGDLDQDQHGHERDVPGQNLSLTSVMPAASGTSPELQAPLLLSSVAAASIWLPSRSSTFASMQGIDPYTRHQMEIPAGPVSTQYLLMARSNLPAPAQYLEGINNMRRGTSVDVNESGTMDHDLRVIETTSVDRAARKDFQSAALPTDEPCCELTALATPVKLHLDSPEWVSASDLIHATMVRRQCSGGTVTAEPNLDRLPNEILMHIFSCLDVCDLLTTSRINHHLRSISLLPILHHHRLKRARSTLFFLLDSPSRPSLSELIARHIFLTHTTQVSRKLARSLVAIRLSRRLPLRPSAKALVLRGVLPGECVGGLVAPALVATKRAVEKERLKDGLRSWVGGVWKGQVWERGDRVRRWDESRGVGRVWKLRQFWERVAKNDNIGRSAA
ncbi:hypothetical protein G7054_g11636 [Neopestalotiopsis clavispora]|nr:hypothetical protein G7054_g11636 [Neopestalotiopsis clavispora]